MPVLVDFWAPTFIVFRGGKPVVQQAGAVQQAQLLRYVQQAGSAAD